MLFSLLHGARWHHYFQTTFSVSKATLIDNIFQARSKYIVLFVLILIGSKMAKWQCGHWCDAFQDSKSPWPINLYINRPCHYLCMLSKYWFIWHYPSSHPLVLHLSSSKSNTLSLSRFVFQLLLPLAPKFTRVLALVMPQCSCHKN